MEPSIAVAFRDLAESNPGQCTFAEYSAIWETIAAKKGGNVLVFGVGRDSPFWIRANDGGQVTFIEHEDEWIAMAREKSPGIDIVPIRYTTRAWAWRLLVHLPGWLEMREIPYRIRDMSWDVIFVDGPQGYNKRCPGRMQSIYTASQLALASFGATDVLVHDVDRQIERFFGDRCLGEDRLVRQVDHLRHYRLGSTGMSGVSSCRRPLRGPG